MQKKLILLFFSPLFLFSQEMFNQSLLDYNKKVVFDSLDISKKIDTLNYIRSQSDGMVLFYNNKHTKVQYIINIGNDSLTVELLDYKRFQWKTNTTGRNNQKSSINKTIAINDINKIHYKNSNIVKHLLRATIITSIFFYIMFSQF